MKSLNLLFGTFFLAVLSSTACRAETVVLKNGEELYGTLQEKNDSSILLQVQYGTLRVAQEKILSINPDIPELLAQREVEAEAKRKLEAQMRAAGKVLYHGKWVTQQEKDAAEAKLAAEQKRKSDDLAKRLADEAKQAQAVTQQQAQAAQQPSWMDQYMDWRRARRAGGSTTNSFQSDRTQNNSRDRNRYNDPYSNNNGSTNPYDRYYNPNSSQNGNYRPASARNQQIADEMNRLGRSYVPGMGP